MSGQEKRVTWVELFFDLVFVVAVTQVSGLLHADHSWPGVGRALVVFVPIYWAWVGMTMHANLHDVDQTRTRLAVFVVGLCGLFMALGLPEAYGSRGLLFGASYWAARLLLYAMMRRRYRAVGFNPFTAAAFVTGPLLTLGGLADGWTRATVWALAAAVDLIVPHLARRRMTGIAYEPSHLPERFGLFLIIALGESVAETGVVAGQQPPTPARLAAVAVAFALACALWWVYFGFAADAIRYAVRTAEVAIDVIRPVLPYGHLAFIGVSVLAASIFNSGLLATPRPGRDARFHYGPVPEDVLRRAHRIADICAAHGVTLPEAAIAFPLRHPAVAGVVVGVRRAEEVRRNLAAYASRVPERLWTDLATAGLIDERVPQVTR